ncbi:MAG: Gfo/Idh/MocA family oxidoreductase [Candidatus Latescibacterota bacterium]
MADEDVAVVAICTPSGMHGDMALEAIARGKHLIVEKPVDVRMEQIERLIEAGGNAGVKMQAIFQSRTEPLHRRMKETIGSGRLGKLIGVQAALPWWREQSYYQGPHGSWKGTWEMDGGGSLMNQGVHTVDLLQWWAGPVRSVMGAFGVFAHEIETEDTSVAVLKFEKGALGTLSTTTCVYPGLPQTILIYGDRGTILVEEGELKLWRIRGEEEAEEEQEMLRLYGPKRKEAGDGISSDPMAVGASGHQGEVEDLVEAIRMDREPFISIESAKHPVQIVHAIYESGRTGREVLVGEGRVLMGGAQFDV